MDQLSRRSCLKLPLATALALECFPSARADQPAPSPPGSPTPPAATSSPPVPAPAPPPSQPYVVTLDVRQFPAGGGPPGWSYLVPLLSAIIAAVVAVLGVVLGQRFASATTTKTLTASDEANQRSMWQKANETELSTIQGKLDRFYGPFMQLAASNQLMADDIRSRQEPGCRLLLKVFDQAWKEGLTPGDAGLLTEVCENAARLEKLILEQAGAVHPALLEYLSRAAAHFRALNLAFKEKLGDDPTNFVRYVFPLQLDPVLHLEVERLEARARVLRANPGSRPPPVEILEIPTELALDAWPTRPVPSARAKAPGETEGGLQSAT